MTLRKYILAKPWEFKGASVIIETGSAVMITENRANELRKAGILDTSKPKTKTKNKLNYGSNGHAD